MTRDADAWLDEIALREASLADARREAAAGELAPEALTQIEAREAAALARARAALEAFTPEVVVERAPRVRRKNRLVIAFFCFVAALTVLLLATLTVRQPGSSITGGVKLTNGQQIQVWLADAQADTAANNLGGALIYYADVISLDPTNDVALTETGWLDFTAGSAAKNASVVAQGVGDLESAVAHYPSDPAPRLYYAIAADLTPGEGALAKAQFRTFLTLHPSRAQLALAAPYLRRLGLG